MISDQSHHLLLLPWGGTSQGMLKNGKAESPIFRSGERWRNTSYIPFICKTCHFYLENIPQIYPPLSTSWHFHLRPKPFPFTLGLLQFRPPLFEIQRRGWMRSQGVSKSIRSLHDRVFSHELVSEAVLFPPPCPPYCVCFNRQVSGRKRVRLHLEPQPRRHLHLISMTKHCSLFLHHMQNLALSQSPDVLSQTGKHPPHPHPTPSLQCFSPPIMYVSIW